MSLERLALYLTRRCQLVVQRHPGPNQGLQSFVLGFVLQVECYNAALPCYTALERCATSLMPHFWRQRNALKLGTKSKFGTSCRGPKTTPLPGQVIIGYQVVPPQASQLGRFDCMTPDGPMPPTRAQHRRTAPSTTTHVCTCVDSAAAALQGGCSCDLTSQGWLIVVILILVRPQSLQLNIVRANLSTTSPGKHHPLLHE